MAKVITINDDYQITSDKYNWILWHWSDGVSKKPETKGQKIRVKRETYHGNIHQISAEIMNREAKKMESLAEIQDLLKNAVTALTEHVEDKL